MNMPKWDEEITGDKEMPSENIGKEIMKLADKARDVAIKHVKQKAARDIITRIKKWRESKISTAKRRWLFELIQNAIDTAKARGNIKLKIEIFTGDNKVIFRHNGGCFTLDEMSAIIYGGSTKPYAPDSEYIGRFGSGFLVSHILNKEAIVSGHIIDKQDGIYKFNIGLNRASDQEDILSKGIDSSFDQLNNSTKKKEISEAYTDFIYDIYDELGTEAVKSGISELKMVVPLLFAYNAIDEIIIDDVPHRKSDSSKNEIQFTTTGEYQVYSKTDGDVQVSVLLKDKGIANLKKMPKLFLGLPLTETADYINIPFIINCKNFDPTDDRDSLNNTPNNTVILKTAFSLYYDLLKSLIENDETLAFLHNLVDFSLIASDRTEQNPILKEFNDCIHHFLEKILSEVPIVKTYDGCKSISNIIFPIEKIFPDRESKIPKEYLKRFYNLLKGINNNIPTENIIEGWTLTAINLKRLSKNVTLYTLQDLRDDLRKFVIESESYPKLIEFKNNFNMVHPKQYFMGFLKLIDELYEKELITDSNFIDDLLINQNNVIGPYKFDEDHLYIEENIPEELKEITNRIGWDIRRNLIDNDFTNLKIINDYVSDILNVDKIIERLLKNRKFWITEKIEDVEDDDKVKGWIDLFRWVVTNDKFCENFPLVSKDNKRIIADDLNQEGFFLPFKYIGIDEEYESIYPDRRILSQRYFEVPSEHDEFIKALKKMKVFITALPILKNDITLGYNKLRSILIEDEELSKVDHKLITENNVITDLPFWNEVIGKISDYPERAKLLFKFILKHIMEQDECFHNQIIIKCSCTVKSHKIIPTQWLAHIKTDTWIPVKTLEGEQWVSVKREATKESIEKLITVDELEELIKNYPDRVASLFPHFGFDELDLKIKLHSIEAGIPEDQIRRDVSKLVDIAAIALEISNLSKKDPEGLMESIKKLKEKQEKDRLKVENKIIGENLEIVISRIISQQGFEVKPIYKGGDLAIWPEEKEGWDSGLVEIPPYLVEVKFTSGLRVHLSKAQSEMASKRKGGYYILAVQNAENLRDRLKVIEKDLIRQDLINLIIDNSFVIENINEKLADFPNPEEVEPDINGYWVKKKLWRDKANVIEWLKSKFGDPIQTS